MTLYLASLCGAVFARDRHDESRKMQWKRWAYGFTGVTVVSLLGQAAFSAALLGSGGGPPSFSWEPAARESFMALNLVPFSVPQRSLHSISSDVQSHLPNYGLESDFQGVPTIMHGGSGSDGRNRESKHPVGAWAREQGAGPAVQTFWVAQGVETNFSPTGAQPFSTQNGTSVPETPEAEDAVDKTTGADGDPGASPQPSPVPLPGAIWLLGFGLLGIGARKQWAKAG